MHPQYYSVNSVKQLAFRLQSGIYRLLACSTAQRNNFVDVNYFLCADIAYKTSTTPIKLT
jgi:hypothetical protein